MKYLKSSFLAKIALVLAASGVGACGGRIDAPIPTDPDDLGSTGTSGSGPGASAPEDLWLVFDVTTGKDAGLHTVRPDGTGLRCLGLPTTARSPAFSRDGNRLAFAGSGGIFTYDLLTRRTVQVTFGADNVPAWSPDGRRLAFTRGLDVRTLDLATRTEQSIAVGPPPGQEWYSNYGHPTFAPDGNAVWFSRRGAIESRSLLGDDPRVLLSASYGAPMVSTSDDGAAAAVSVECEGRGGTSIISTLPNAVSTACSAGTPVGRALTWTRPAIHSTGEVAYVSSMHTIDARGQAGLSPVKIVDTRQSLGGGYVGEVAWARRGGMLP